MDEKRLEELFSNQEFVNALGAADKAEEVVRIFAEHDVEVSKEDAEALLAARDKAPEGELSEDALDGVAGGSRIGDWIRRFPRPRFPWPRFPLPRYPRWK